MSDLTSYVTHMGARAVGVIDFSGVGGAAGVITIGGVSYTEADTADAPNGVWTNGADAAAGAASLVAAINGDTRSTAPPVTAVASDVADSVVVTADAVGKAGNLAMTTSAANTTVDAAMYGGEEPARLEVCIVQRAVTAQDVLADEVNIGLPFTPDTVPQHSWQSAAGLNKSTISVVASVETGNRLLLNFAGAVDPVATDIVTVVATRRMAAAIAAT